MPVFQYKGFDAGGAARAGIVDADSPREARLQLRSMRVHITELEPLAALTVGTSRRFLPAFMQRRHRDEIVLMTRQLGTMLRSGIPLASCLTALVEQAGKQDLEVVLRDIREKVTQGATFADALAHHPGYFDDLYVNMVKAGEAAGNLDVILSRLADFTQKQERIRAKVKAALAYPMVMIIFGVLVVTVLMTFVVPRILSVLQKGGSGGKGAAPLPMPTQILVSVSSFMGNYWYYLLAALVIAWMSFRAAMRSEEFQYKWDRFRLKLPILGDLFQKSAVSRFCTTFATLLKSGIPALQSLTIVKGIVGNKVIARVVDEIHQKIVEGQDISGPVKKSGVFPPVVGYMIAVGEQAGTLEEMLERIAESYDSEVEITSQKVTSMLEPILIVALSLVVGFIVVAILLPILQIGSLANRR
jgi:general secretion pathway protein F